MAIRSKDLSPKVRAMMNKQAQRGGVATGPRLDSVTITLPLPGKALSPNWRGHWWSKAGKVAESRLRAARRTIIALEGQGPLWERATIQATFYHPQRRDRDGDNLNASLKSAQDGLVDAGLLADDKGVTNLPPIQLIDRDRPRVVLTVTRLEDLDDADRTENTDAPPAAAGKSDGSAQVARAARGQ